ncbi:MAG: 30S ribosomal protein S20 [Mariprofundales bacterium]|nr:30S ribosomal protein S20 [Mariprofundales bacterium]
MANHASALKRARQSLKIRDRQRGQRSAMRSAIKQVNEAVAQGDRQLASSALRAAVKLLDAAGQKRLIHPRQASRRVSRLNRSVMRISAS